ncbi:hypothetical protein K1719_041052 [Acacia pycnantha]|nr:hypothetical protein K1719_041052 [Acacia pycnantha]
MRRRDVPMVVVQGSITRKEEKRKGKEEDDKTPLTAQSCRHPTFPACGLSEEYLISAALSSFSCSFSDIARPVGEGSSKFEVFLLELLMLIPITIMVGEESNDRFEGYAQQAFD